MQLQTPARRFFNLQNDLVQFNDNTALLAC